MTGWVVDWGSLSIVAFLHLTNYILDKIFLNVLKRHPDKMPKIFFDMFNGSSEAVIKFLSNKSNFVEDLKVIFKMPKMLFIKNIF